jgi:hypothetical protein
VSERDTLVRTATPCLVHPPAAVSAVRDARPPSGLPSKWLDRSVRSAAQAVTLTAGCLAGAACHDSPPPAPPNGERRIEPPRQGTSTPPSPTPEKNRSLAGAPSRVVYLLDASALLPEGAESSECVVRLNGSTVWKGAVNALHDAPEVVQINLAEPLPRSGTLQVEISVGGATYGGSAEARGDASLEVRCRPERGGIKLDWNEGDGYK